MLYVALTTIIFTLTFFVLQESIIHDFFRANGQVQNNIELFARVVAIPCCYYLGIIFIFA